jgi:hypothetical protein
MVSLNNLTDQSQFLTTGTSGTNFAIVSSGDTHTFNLPVASASNTGKLSSTDWSTFNGKVPYTGATAAVNLGAFDLTVNGLIVGKGGGSISTNTVLGTTALSSNTTGASNVAIGINSLNTNTTGGSNVAVGQSSLQTNNSNQNTAIGNQAMQFNTTGTANTGIGHTALQNNTTGNNNIAIGYESGKSITTGSNNTIIGNYAGTTTLANNIVLADGAGNIRYQWNGINNVFGNPISGTTASFTSSGGSDTFAINHSSGSGIALNITKGGNGEGLYINKTSGSGNAATIIGTLNATTLVKSGGTSSQFLKADGSVDSSTYLTTSAASSTYLPLAGGTLTGALSGTSATFTNSGTGIGVGITNSGNGDGIKITHSLGRAFNIQSSGSGFGIIINNETASTSIPFTIQKQGGSVVSITDAGQLTLANSATALSFVKSGGTSSQFLMADGSVNTSVLPSGAYLPLTGGTLTGALSGTDISLQSSNFDILKWQKTSGTASNIYSLSADASGAYIQDVTNTKTLLYLAENTGAATFSSSVTGGLITADNADIYSQNGTGSNLSIGFKQSSAVKFRLRYDIATDIVAMVGSSGNFIQYWNQAGNVGLGVTPALGVALDIRNNSTTTLADFRNANSGGFGIYIAAGSTTSHYVQRWADYQNNALMTFNGVGNLLIGTTTDAGQKLQVSGMTNSGISYRAGTYTQGDTTPSVSGVSYFGISNSSPTTITNFTNGIQYQIITLYFSDSNTTINRSNCYLSGGVNFTSTAADILTLINIGGFWYEVSRSVNS